MHELVESVTNAEYNGKYRNKFINKAIQYTNFIVFVTLHKFSLV